MGQADTLDVTGEEHVVAYTTFSNPPGPNLPAVELRLHNYGACGSHLYIYAPAWGDWVYPAASAIDTPLPEPPEFFHINLA